MPLSEEELRLLEQMERALVEEDPKFASTLRGTTLRSTARRRALLAGVGFVIGVTVLMTGAIAQTPLIGIAGFVVMLASATLGLAALRGQRNAPAAEVPETPDPKGHGFTLIHGGKKGRTRKAGRQSSGSFMERMEQRWNRRRERGF
ncbi:DUF3040 domain-containing protein [Nocardioides sp. GCM10027113]|uniref:DUF3040 domain-containing protein n=1 Tax=unclassified Nocardioides TaxID=2615069 RepID=UPI003613F706